MTEEVKKLSDPELMRDTCQATIHMATQLIQVVNAMSRMSDVPDMPLVGHIGGIGNFLEAIVRVMGDSDCFVEEPVPAWINTIRIQVRDRWEEVGQPALKPYNPLTPNS